jgi:hypothetical protein
MIESFVEFITSHRQDKIERGSVCIGNRAEAHVSIAMGGWDIGRSVQRMDGTDFQLMLSSDVSNTDGHSRIRFYPQGNEKMNSPHEDFNYTWEGLFAALDRLRETMIKQGVVDNE